MLHLYGADESTLFVIDCRLCFDYVIRWSTVQT